MVTSLAGTMNYNHDTEHDLQWAQSSLRKEEKFTRGVSDAPVRRIASTLARGEKVDGGVSNDGLRDINPDTTIAGALSALSIHAHSPAQVQRICDCLYEAVTDRNRPKLHSEVVEIKGVDLILNAVKTHATDEQCVLSALRLLEKLTRTSTKEIIQAGGLDVVLARVDPDQNPSSVVAQGLRVLHGLTFQNDAKLLLLRRGVRGLAEDLQQTKHDERADKEERERWGDVVSIATRLCNRLQEGQRGYSNVWKANPK